MPAALGGASPGRGSGLHGVASAEGQAEQEQRAGHTGGARGLRPASPPGTAVPRWKWEPYGTERGAAAGQCHEA